MVTVMEQNSPAEELPALYRAILDRVARLEMQGERAEAARVRATATRIYSRAWDERARRGLVALLREAQADGPGDGATGETATDEATTGHGIRTGSVATS